MKRLILVVLLVIVAIALLVGLIVLIGSRLPEAHVASRSVFLHQPPRQVYAVVRDFGAAPAWRSDIKSVDVEQQPGGGLHFREHDKHGRVVNYELVTELPTERLATRILDTDLGYSGKWTYVFADENGGTRLTITEEGEVSNVLFRFMSRYVFGHTATLDSYLTALAKRFGETASPQ